MQIQAEFKYFINWFSQNTTFYKSLYQGCNISRLEQTATPHRWLDDQILYQNTLNIMRKVFVAS